MRHSALVVGVCLALALACAAGGKIIYVDDDAQPGGDGKSWATAYRYLQDALADAKTAEKPVEVRVDQGFYRPDRGAGQELRDRSASFQLINGVSLKGGYAGYGAPDPNARDISLRETVLSGDLAGNDVDVDDPFNLLGGPGRTENSLNVIVGFYVGPDALLDGIVITGGYSDMHTDRGGPVAGAGLFNYSSSPTIINCTFTGNATAEVGGGMLNRNGSNAKVRNCTFSRNYAHYGGGAANWQSHPEFTRCVFLMNGAGFNGGGMDNQQGSSPKLLDCTFSHNRAKSSGGGLCSDIGSPILIDCILADNWAGWQGGAVSCAGLESTGCTFTANRAEDAGGAVRASGKLILSNCIIMRNDAVRLGGGIYIMYEDRSSLTNCTFAGNSAVNGRAFACDSQGQQYPSDISAVNCILWDGGDEISNRDGSRIEIAYSDIQFGQDGVHDPCSGVLWGPGNIRSEPLFSDIDRKDVHLKSQAGRWDPNRRSWIKDDVTSPCIDAGNMAWSIGTEPFPNGGRINLGAYGGTSEASKSYFGKPVCETVVAGDINGDCRVDSGDLAILANHWLEER